MALREFEVPIIPDGREFTTVEDAQTPKKSMWKPTQDEEDRKKRIESRIENDMMTDKQPHEQQWKRNIERTMGVVYDNAKAKGRSRFVTKDAFIHIDTKLAEKTKSLPRFVFVAAETEDSWKAWVMEQCRKHAETKMKFTSKYYRWNYHKLLFGVGIMRIGYKQRWRTVKIRVEGTIDTYREVTVPDYDDLFCYVVSPFHFFVDPNALTLDDAEDCAEFKIINWNQFQQDYHLNPMYKNTEFVVPGMWHGLDDHIGDISRATPSTQVLIAEYFNKIRDEWVTYANGIEIRNSPLPDDHKMLPYVDLHNKANFSTGIGRTHSGEIETVATGIRESFWSKGDPELIGQEQDQKTAFRRAHLDGAKRANTNIVVTDGFALDSNMTDWYNGTPVIGGMGRIGVMPLGRTDPSYLQVTGELDQDMSKITGVDPAALINMDPQEKATKTAIRRESMLTRVRADNIIDETTGITRLGTIMMRLIQQWYTKPQVLRITGMEDISKYHEVVRDAETGIPLFGGRYRRISSSSKIKEKKVSGDENKGDARYKLIFDDEGSDTFLARPEYILMGADLDVRVEAESSVAPSREIEKAISMEAMQMTAQLMGFVQEGFITKEDVPNVRYASERWAMAMGWDLQQAMGNQSVPTQNQGKEAMNMAQGFRAGGISAGIGGEGIPRSTPMAGGITPSNVASVQ